MNEGCYTCQRDIEYSYLCTEYAGCTPIAFEVEGLCVSPAVNNTNTSLICDVAWVDERSTTNSYFTCDKDCLELYPEESSDCQSGCSLYNDACALLWNLLLIADSNGDIRISVDECVYLLETVPRYL